MKNLTYRFLPEYANEKKARLKRITADFPGNGCVRDAVEIAVKRIDYVLQSCHKGFITLDEAMRQISTVDPMEYAGYLRNLAFDKIPYFYE